MEHAKKVFLVDPNPATAAKSNAFDAQLDREIDRILKQNLPGDKKIALYQDAILRFQQTRKNLNQPMKVTLTSPTPSINWNGAGELTHHDVPIPGSSVEDLLDRYVAARMATAPKKVKTKSRVPIPVIVEDEPQEPVKEEPVKKKPGEKQKNAQTPKRKSTRKKKTKVHWSPY